LLVSLPLNPASSHARAIAGKPMIENASGYRVLARKYRPASFADLIGQEPMVRTLRNAFAAGRVPHAWMLTGVRGVGKTTTARILARGLNFQREDESGEPTVDLNAEGIHCRAILEGRHPDVIEMDAASHTGIDDIRDIIDSARYSPVSARYKVYIIDEVHMLSKQAFNGLLKTLEEPPAHVKFVFATTEIRKVPVTVLSRCQRFDLRRIEAAELVGLLTSIAGKEGVSAEPEALRQIARAAEGSARDALSMLDQAIAHGGGGVVVADVQDMLGLADRARIVDLFEHVMRGDVAAALAELATQHETGADPATVLTDLAEFTHYVTRLKVAPNAAGQAAVSETERLRGAAFAAELSLRVLSRAWQMLVKGIAEVAEASRPLAAAEMALVRLCHAADLPTPEEALRVLEDAPATPAPTAAVAARPTMPALAPRGGRVQAQQAAAEPLAQHEPALRRFEDIVARARQDRDLSLSRALERHVRPVRMEQGRLEIALTAEADPGLPQQLGLALAEWTGMRWMVAVTQEAGSRTLHEQRGADRATLLQDAGADPLVRQVLERFPGAEIVDVRERAAPDAAIADIPAHAPIDED
jgi:DNA polymerase III subunit gamma/tau